MSSLYECSRLIIPNFEQYHINASFATHLSRGLFESCLAYFAPYKWLGSTITIGILGPKRTYWLFVILGGYTVGKVIVFNELWGEKFGLKKVTNSLQKLISRKFIRF